MCIKTNIKSVILTLGLVGATVGSTDATPFRPAAINISGDSGGRIGSYVKKVNRAGALGTFVRFKGRCDSACTLYLALPRSKTCISPGAKFRFHQPTGGSAAINRQGARYLMEQYPGWVRAWISSNGGLNHRLITMDYEYASKYLDPCIESPKRKTFAFGRKLGKQRLAMQFTGR